MAYSSDTQTDGIVIPDIVEQPCGLYPGVEAFSADYDAADYLDWVDQSNGDPLPAPLVLYLQNKASADADMQGREPLHAMEHELRLQGALFDDDRPLKQLICTGSIVTDWSDVQLSRLVTVIRSSFYVNHDSLNNWCACSGREVPSAERLKLLRALGFTHLRLAPADAQALQIERMGFALHEARQLGFRVTILDLRKVAGNTEVLKHAIVPLLESVQPDRIRLSPFGEDPSAGGFLGSFGYQDIGLGWYLRTNDSWWHARNSGRLHWTMLGYGELQSPDVVGIGPGALSAVCDFYSLNDASQNGYAESLESGLLPIVGGVALEDADVLRREIIAMILSSSAIRVEAIENKWGIRFEQFFRCESELLRVFERNRWLSWHSDHIEIRTRACRELMEICRVFDGRAGNPLTHVTHPGGRSAGAAHIHSAAVK